MTQGDPLEANDLPSQPHTRDADGAQATEDRAEQQTDAPLSFEDDARAAIMAWDAESGLTAGPEYGPEAHTEQVVPELPAEEPVPLASELSSEMPAEEAHDADWLRTETLLNTGDEAEGVDERAELDRALEMAFDEVVEDEPSTPEEATETEETEPADPVEEAVGSDFASDAPDEAVEASVEASVEPVDDEAEAPLVVADDYEEEADERAEIAAPDDSHADDERAASVEAVTVDAADAVDATEDDDWPREEAGFAQDDADEKPVETPLAEDDEEPVHAVEDDAVQLAGDTSETGDEVLEASSDEIVEAPVAEPEPEEPVAAQPQPARADDANSLGLQAITALSERMMATDARYDTSLEKISHAIGVIAGRIDGIESRLAERAIQDIASIASPPRDESAVAPYIANAERELEAKKEAGPVDIFDRIARAAETEFDSSRSAMPGGSLVEEIGDGRRVGTKKWTPSKTVKRRMQQLGEAQGANSAAAAAAAPLGKTLSPEALAEVEAREEERRRKATATAAPVDAQPEPKRPVADNDSAAEAAAEAPLPHEDEDDDAGLSVLPGARGRRRDRARKSRLDEDFETVFGEENDQPSINRLRRKMRDTAPESPEEEAAPAKSGLGALLGGGKDKKKAEAKAADPKPKAKRKARRAEEEVDDEDLMAAFDDPDMDDDFDEDMDEADAKPGNARFMGGPLLYVGIAALAGAVFALSYMFLA